jgi:hypothetical protein
MWPHLGAVNGDCLLECHAICRLAVVRWLVLGLMLALLHRGVPIAVAIHASIGGGAAWVQAPLACSRRQLRCRRCCLAPAAAGEQQAQAQQPQQAGAHSRSQDDPQTCGRWPEGCEQGRAGRGQGNNVRLGWVGSGPTARATIQGNIVASLQLRTFWRTCALVSTHGTHPRTPLIWLISLLRLHPPHYALCTRPPAAAHRTRPPAHPPTHPPETCLKLIEVLVLTPLSQSVRGMAM